MVKNSTPPVSSEIIVYKPSWFKRPVQFLQKDTTVGDLNFTSLFRMNASANLFGQHWTITQSGFWRTTLEFKQNESPYTKVKIQVGFRGQLEYRSTNGEVYTFRKVKWYKTTSAWFDHKGNPVMEIRTSHSFSKRQAIISIFKAGEPDITVMILMAYVIFTIERTRAAAAAT